LPREAETTLAPSCRAASDERLDDAAQHGLRRAADGLGQSVSGRIRNDRRQKLTREKSIALYRQYARDAFNERDLRACLRGKNLACWCPLDQPCHADVLLEMANSA
jgi:hypothetical protein